MNKNVGTLDTILRVIVALVIAILYLTDIITGTTALILGIVALVLLATGLIGWCGIYALFGISTSNKKEPEA